MTFKCNVALEDCGSCDPQPPPQLVFNEEIATHFQRTWDIRLITLPQNKWTEV